MRENLQFNVFTGPTVVIFAANSVGEDPKVEGRHDRPTRGGDADQVDPPLRVRKLR